MNHLLLALKKQSALLWREHVTGNGGWPLGAEEMLSALQPQQLVPGNKQ